MFQSGSECNLSFLIFSAVNIKEQLGLMGHCANIVCMQYADLSLFNSSLSVLVIFALNQFQNNSFKHVNASLPLSTQVT